MMYLLTQALPMSLSNWNEVAKLTASDAEVGDNFGNSVSISGDKAIVGAFKDDNDSLNQSGSAYVFERDSGGNWNEVTKLTASDAEAGDIFGNSVSISGDKSIVGAFGNDDAGRLSGSAYVFERDSGGNWNEVAKLTASDAAIDDLFGTSVSISGDKAIVGSPDDDEPFDSGSAYVFERDSGGNWNEVTKLTASDAGDEDAFGISVSISGDKSIVGAALDDNANTNSGSAYLFVRDSGGNWNEVAKLTASDTASGDAFGFPVSISGDKSIVGSPGDDDEPFNSGSAYVFEISNNPPDCSGATPSQDIILQDMVWPPNHKFVDISISGVTDPDGDTVTTTITKITQDEPTSGTGSGDQSPDGTGVGTDTAQLRVERLGTGDGRVYEISFTANDGNGGTCTGSVFVIVPHDQSANIAVDNGQNFDSTI